MSTRLEQFHPLVRQWFETTFSAATAVQSRAWPLIARGENLLITAPTGSGKTLTAFLWSINRFITGDLQPGTTRVLYVSPLKALNNDIQRNLLTPLDSLKKLFLQQGLDFPEIDVQTRSGDTEAGDRRRMLRDPPEILITTPESLNLLLSSRSGQTMLQGIRTVILDEIHGVIDTKRGTWLMSAVERLVPLAGEFQRIALSATVRPLELVASQVAGFLPPGAPGAPGESGGRDGWSPRPITIVESDTGKSYSVSVRFPDEVANRSGDETLWDSLAHDFYARIKQNRSTLLFVNSRAMCEKITWKINNVAGHTVAYAHHGSLSREIRADVEQKLKQGDLAAIVATSSLEMGIDIGSLDEVILIQSPTSISAAIQRIGRAGHAVGQTSRATIYPSDPRDIIETAVLTDAILTRDIEAVRPVECPLDVLAQIIISMTGIAQWRTDELLTELRRSTAFHNLTERQFNLVVNMLAGRYADQHIRELRPKIDYDRINSTITARKGALMALYLSGGVIPDRGYFQLRHEDSNARIGELDEEFVWEAKIGQVFSLGTQRWQVRKITHNDVVVSPARASDAAPPFWKAESLSRDFHYASRVGEFLEHANDRLEEKGFKDELITRYHLEDSVADTLLAFLRRQRDHCRVDLPHRHHLLMERVEMAPGGAKGHQAVLHTGWGARVNRPLAMALEAGWERKFGELPEIYVSNECIVVQIPHEIGVHDLLALVPVEDLESLLRQRLEGSGFFAARFRENAGRALLLSRGRFNERKPLWMSRLQSQKLMDAVLKYEDFPILLETWRTCLRDEFDLENLKTVLSEVCSGIIRVTEISAAAPGPFAQSVAWGQINQYMYLQDQPRSNRTSSLHQDLLQEVVFEPGLRPAIPGTIIDEFVERRQRLAPGYAPETPGDAIEWVKERTAVPEPEWLALMEPAGIDDEDFKEQLTRIPGGTHPLVVVLEDRESLASIFHGDNDDELGTRLGNWLQYYGPLGIEQMVEKLGIGIARLLPALNELEEERLVVAGPLIQDDERIYWCDAANFEVLLRVLRQGSRFAFETLPAEQLMPFLHHWQTRYTRTDDTERLYECLERLRCLSCPADFWETALLPARLANYDGKALDVVFQETGIGWIGTGEKAITLTFQDDLDLLFAEPPATPEAVERLLPDPRARFDFGTLLDRSGLAATELARTLWHGAWRSAVTNDTFAALRRGIETGFKANLSFSNSRRRRSGRASFGQWQSLPFSGNWYRPEYPASAGQGIELEELNKDRVRVLLDRYGIVFRELLLRELPAFRWNNLFRSLRLMELSGEVYSGHFFSNIPGPQFISPQAHRILTQGLSDDEIFWINAADPISVCGSGIDVPDDLPRRVPSNHLVFHGSRLVLVSQRNGKILDIRASPDDEHLPHYLNVIRHLAYRSFQPIRKISIELINGKPARQSEYLEVLKSMFDIISDHKSVYIQREV